MISLVRNKEAREMTAAYSSEEFEARYTYTGNDLGSRWQPDHTFFRVWAPTAQAVSVLLYRSGTPGADDLICSLPMKADVNGTWTLSCEGDCSGIYYTYRVTIDGVSSQASDPYSRSTGVNGKRSMVVNLLATNPPGWENDRSPAFSGSYTDYVIYELHLRDISASASSGISAKGKYLGLAQTGSKTKSGLPTGLDHIRQLGVTHVHLLPVFDFGSVDEADPKRHPYNWGYDPVNFNVPEGSYATDPHDGSVRIREFKQLIQALHCNGLGVIMDVVYNHVYHTFEFSMNRLTPLYFSRQNEAGILSNGSFCGNDTASERSMVRKFIVDSVNYWADEYHIDGFRFDLAGLLDVMTIQQTIQTVRQKHPHVMFYGEGWYMDTQVTKSGVPLAVQANAWMLPDFAFFNDTIRDTLCGSVFDRQALGFATGAWTPRGILLDCFLGRPGWTGQPTQVVNYISCHDNFTLHDRIAEALPQADEQEITARCRLAGAFNLLSVGIPFFQAGEEMLRSKTSRAGKRISNSYRSSDLVNAIRWNRLKDPEVFDTVQYYRGLIALRKAHALLRISSAEKCAQSIHIMQDIAEPITAFLLENQEEALIVAFNPTLSQTDFPLPDGKWSVYVKDTHAGVSPIEAVSGSATVPALSALVLGKL